MPTVKELMEMVSANKDEVIKVIEKSAKELASTPRNDSLVEAIKKANKVDRLRKLCKMGSKIGFIVHTPGTECGRTFHCVNMIEANVVKTSDGNFIINGVDVELTMTKIAEKVGDVSKRIMFSKINPEYKVYRSYRIDRILDGTITFE